MLFSAGTTAKCNRCGLSGPLPKDCEGHEDHKSPSIVVYRLDTMCALRLCGHMDAQRVYVTRVEGVSYAMQ